MYLSYIDSSGGPEYSDPENFVLAAIIIHDHSWRHIKREIRNIKSKHFPDIHPDNVELHVKDILNRSGIYKKISLNATYSIFDDLFEFITAKETDLDIIGVIVDKKRKYLDNEVFGYIPVLERFNRYLAQRNNMFQKANESLEYGMTIIDSAGMKDQKLQSKLEPILNKGTIHSNFNYLMSGVLFTNSRWNELVQIADCVAYCMRKHHRVNSSSDVHVQYWNRYYSMLKDKFYSRDGQYVGYGLKII